ncbi:hypothetical protein ACPXAZ_25080, partial [Escherichia coli]|uniref:hypothetical protein n=1 Tax=Escherichia coli TaxID=562 RepID=UPI003CE59474
GVHNYSRRPANNYGLSSQIVHVIQALQSPHTTTLFFGNPYAISNAANANNLLACYEDDDLTQLAAADILLGRAEAKGTLSVTVTPNLP